MSMSRHGGANGSAESENVREEDLPFVAEHPPLAYVIAVLALGLRRFQIVIDTYLPKRQEGGSGMEGGKMASQIIAPDKRNNLRGIPRGGGGGGRMQRLAVLAALRASQNQRNNTSSSQYDDPDVFLLGYNVSTSNGGATTSKSGRFETDLHGNVNILLGGAMLGGVIMVVVLICYCCHKSARKNRPQEYSRYWRAEPDGHSLEVFTMDSHGMCYEGAGDVHRDEVGRASSLPCPITPRPSLMSASASASASTSASACVVTQLSLPSPLTMPPPPPYESLVFERRNSYSFNCDKHASSGEHPGGILPVPSVDLESVRSRRESSAGSIRDDEGLPSYEAALKLEADGYV